MSDVDVIIRVHTQGVQEIGNLSASLRNLSNSLRGINVPMAKLDTHTKAVYKALGVTSRGVDQHAKSIKGLIQNQRVLGTETKNITRDLNGLRNAYALAGRESTALGRAIGVSTKELSGFSRTFRGMRLRAFGSDLSNISLRLTKLGKDAQFVGRSLMINLTLPLATFARVGLQNFLAMEKQSVRLIKVMENLASTSDMAAQKILGLQNATAADLSGGQIDRANQMVQAYRKMDKALIDLSLRFGVSKDLTTSLAADFAELGLTAEENVQNITQLTLEIEKLGSMDIGPAQDLSQALFFQSKRAFEVTGAMNRLTTARAREKKAIESSITQMYLFNAIENATALTLKDLGDSFAEISAMATSYGLSMTEAAALLAPMKAAGLDIGASANSIKVSLQRLLAPTKQNVDMLQKLAEQFGVASGAQNEFMMSTKTGLIGLQSVVTMFDKVRKSSQGSEGALRLMSDLFEKRQGPRMYLAIEQLADFNNELQKADDNFSNLPSSTVSAELQLVRTADAAAKKFKNFNTTAVPTTIRSFKDIGNVARIATAFAGQVIEFEPGKGTVITAQDIQNAKEMRKAVSETILEAKQSKGIDLISEVKTEAGRALMIQLAGAANASEVANQELARSLQTAGVSVESIRTTFKMFAADIIAYLIPTIQKLAEKVKQMYETWNSPEFAQTRANIIRLITIVGGFLGILGPIILAIGTFQAVIGKVGLAMTRMIPKLKNADGGLTLLGKSAEFAKKQMNDLYEIFMKTTGVAQAARAGRSGLAPLVPAAGAPALGPARPLIPGSRAGTFLTPRNATDLQALGNVTERTKAIQAARLAKAGLQDITGGPTAAEQQAAFQRYLRSRPTATRLPPAHMAAAMGLPTTTPELQAAFDRFRTLTPAQRSDLTPTSSRRAARRQISAAQKFADRAGIFEAAGVGVTQEMSETGRVGRERFAFRGRDITREQAESIGRGGPRAALTRAQIRGQAIRSGLAARPGVAAFRGAMPTGPLTVGGVASGSVAAIKASTTAMVQNMGSVKGAKAAVAALNAQYALMGGAAPGAMRRLTVATMGAVKGLKIATLAAKVFRMALMFTGIGAIIAVVASVIFLVVKNLDKIKGSAKFMEPLKAAFNAVKDAVFMVIRPIQDLFAQFGSGADEGEASGNAIVKAFEGIAAAIAFVAGLFKAFVEKVIQPYLYGIVNIVMAVVSMFKGNWGDAFKFLIAGVASIVKGVINLFVGLGSGIVTVLAKAITVVLDLFGKIPLVGGVFRLASKGVNALANTYKSVARSVADFAIKGLDKVVDLGIKKSTNKISSGAKKQEKAATDAGNLAGEAIANAYGDAPIGGANDKIAGKIKEGLADAAQDLYDYVVERFASSIKKFVSESVKALNKQKESALKVFDIQLNTLVKLERAEESLTRKKEYETNRRKLIDDAALRQQNYLRDRALAIYEGRIDDARILDQEERVASRESDAEIGTLDEGRRKELAKENLDALKEAINEAKEVANRFFEESIEKFQDAAEHITRIAPVTQEQYAAQLEELRLKTIEYSDKNNTEFGTMFEKFSTTIAERMPNTVDDFGKALGAFATPLDELVTLAMNKYGLGSEWDNTVLGVTSKMADSVIGITLGMLVDIGGAFETSAPEITERFGDVTGGIAGEIGTFKTEALASFTTLLEEVKLQFLTPFKKALDEADPTTVFKNAIIDGNQEILNSFKKLVRLNPDLMKQMAASLDPAIAKYLALKAAADAAADAMSNAGGGGGLGDTGGVPFGEDKAEWNRFMRIKEKTDAQMAAALKAMGDSYSRGLAASGNFQPIYENRAATFKNRYNTYISPEQIRANANPLSRKEGGPIPIGAALKSTPFGISGFLNAPEQEGIPAILHGGEFVVNAEAVKRIGLGALAKLNDPRIPKFKKGGFVGTADQAERKALATAKSLTAKNTINSTADSIERKIKQDQQMLKDPKFQEKLVDNFGIAGAKRVVENYEEPIAIKKAIAQNKKVVSAAYAGMSPREKFTIASVGNFKRSVERAEAPLIDTGSFGGGVLDQLEKIGSQDGLIDKLTRFDKSSVDLIAGGIGRSGKILKGVYSNVLSPMAESFNATFINPAINAGGRLIGKNPNLRQAGLVESAVNIADVLSTILSFGAGKVATTTGKVTLNTLLKQITKGTTKTASELLVEKTVQQAVKASAKSAANAGRLTLGQSARVGAGMATDNIGKATSGVLTKLKEKVGLEAIQKFDQNAKETAILRLAGIKNLTNFRSSPDIERGPEILMTAVRGVVQEQGDKSIAMSLGPVTDYLGATTPEQVVAIARMRGYLISKEQAEKAIVGRFDTPYYTLSSGERIAFNPPEIGDLFPHIGNIPKAPSAISGFDMATKAGKDAADQYLYATIGANAHLPILRNPQIENAVAGLRSHYFNQVSDPQYIKAAHQLLDSIKMARPDLPKHTTIADALFYQMYHGNLLQRFVARRQINSFAKSGKSIIGDSMAVNKFELAEAMRTSPRSIVRYKSPDELAGVGYTDERKLDSLLLNNIRNWDHVSGLDATNYAVDAGRRSTRDLIDFYESKSVNELMEQVLLVHETPFKPIMDDFGNVVIKPTGYYDPNINRQTVHFAVNHRAGGHMLREGVEEGSGYVVISTLNNAVSANPGTLHTLGAVDTYFSAGTEGLRLPRSGVRVVKNTPEDIAAAMNELAPNKSFKPQSFESSLMGTTYGDDATESYLQYIHHRLGVPSTGVGHQGKLVSTLSRNSWLENFFDFIHSENDPYKILNMLSGQAIDLREQYISQLMIGSAFRGAELVPGVRQGIFQRMVFDGPAANYADALFTHMGGIEEQLFIKSHLLNNKQEIDNLIGALIAMERSAINPVRTLPASNVVDNIVSQIDTNVRGAFTPMEGPLGPKFFRSPTADGGGGPVLMPDVMDPKSKPFKFGFLNKNDLFEAQMQGPGYHTAYHYGDLLDITGYGNYPTSTWLDPSATISSSIKLGHGTAQPNVYEHFIPGSGGKRLYVVKRVAEGRGHSEVTKEIAARSEVLASRIYELMGMKTVRPQMLTNLTTASGDPITNAIVSRYFPDIIPYSTYLEGIIDPTLKRASRRKLQKGSLIDAWLGNYDVVGFSPGSANLGVLKNIDSSVKQVIRTDVGGSLGFSGTGKIKVLEDMADQATLLGNTTPSFGPTVLELDQFFKGRAGYMPQANAFDLFHDIPENTFLNDLFALRNLDINALKLEVERVFGNQNLSYELGDVGAGILETLLQRRQYILQQYEEIISQTMAKHGFGANDFHNFTAYYTSMGTFKPAPKGSPDEMLNWASPISGFIHSLKDVSPGWNKFGVPEYPHYVAGAELAKFRDTLDPDLLGLIMGSGGHLRGESRVRFEAGMDLLKEYTGTTNKAINTRLLDAYGESSGHFKYLQAYYKMMEYLSGSSSAFSTNFPIPSALRKDYSDYSPLLEGLNGPRPSLRINLASILQDPKMKKYIDLGLLDMEDIIKTYGMEIPEDMNVFRGIKLYAPMLGDRREYLDSIYKPGNILPPQYMSTSLSPQVALGFANPTGASFPVIENIQLSKGQKMWVPQVLGQGVFDEYEFIVPPWYQFEVKELVERVNPLIEYPEYQGPAVIWEAIGRLIENKNPLHYATAMKAAGSSIPKFKKGGYVKGMTSTAIPAMLHGGEYVLNAKAVQQLGLPYLNAMNQVSQSQFRPPSSRVNAPSGNVTNNVSTVNIQVENFIGEEAWFESMMKEYNVNVLPKNQKLAGLEQRKFTSYNGINQGM